jgi:YVTN family beta-propeller protein
MSNLKHGAFAAAVLASITFTSLLQTTLAHGNLPSTALLSSRAIVFSPATHKVYAVDRDRGAIFIINESANSVSSVKVGSEPVAIAVNAFTGRVYVANSGSGTVSVLDEQQDSIVATISVDPLPYVLAVSEATNRIYVSNTFSDLLTIIDGTTNATTTLKTGSADAIAIDPKAGKVYLLGYQDSNLIVLDEKSGEQSKVPMGMHLWGMALSEDSHMLYATLSGSAAVVALDENSRALTNIPTGEIPCAVAVNPSTNTAYVANYRDNSVTVIDGARGLAISKVPVGDHPQAIAVDPKANLVYVANTHGNSVSVIDGTSNTVIATLDAPDHPYAVAVSPGTGRVYVANLGERPFAILDRPKIRSQSQ